jgi:trehalose/maltose hydrolase-like predicted phosphorylase
LVNDHRKDRQGAGTGTDRVTVDGSRLIHESLDDSQEPWAETLFTVANGTLGVRAAPWWGSDRPTTFMASAYETTPVRYHERLKGFASSTDTRVPVADGTQLTIKIDGRLIGIDEPHRLERTLDLRTGVLTMRSIFDTAAGPIEVLEERLVPFADAAAVVMRLTILSHESAVNVTVGALLSSSQSAAEQGDDPRIGTSGVADAVTVEYVDAATGVMVELVRRSRIRIASAIALEPYARAHVDSATRGLIAYVHGTAAPGAPMTFTKAVAYQVDTAASDAALAIAAASQSAITTGFDALVACQRMALDAFWRNADICIEGNDDSHGEAELALRANMFHVFQSAGRDGTAGIAAKGLTGEGYEGHVFWDGEVFVLPMLICTAPDRARAALEYAMPLIGLFLAPIYPKQSIAPIDDVVTIEDDWQRDGLGFASAGGNHQVLVVHGGTETQLFEANLKP